MSRISPRRHALQALAAATLLTWAGALRAAPPVNTLRNSVFGGSTDTAINGYDPVAYITQGKAVKGQDAHSHLWMGATWKFASRENLERFRADPERHAPQYGGYCAFGVAKGSLVKVDPEQFTVLDGKLYLNFDAGVQKQWLQDPQRYIREADSRFPALLKR